MAVTIRYVGPFDLVEFEDAHGLHAVARGATIEVADETAPGLLAQPSNWQKVRKPRKAASKAKREK